MIRVAIGALLAVCLIGCAEKPKFLISESDDVENCVSKPEFIKIEKTVEYITIGCKFFSAPESLYRVKTDDLDIVGGYYVGFEKNTRNEVRLSFRGKKAFDELKNRIIKNYVLTETRPLPYEKDLGFMWFTDDERMVVLTYDTFSDYGQIVFSKSSKL